MHSEFENNEWCAVEKVEKEITQNASCLKFKMWFLYFFYLNQQKINMCYHMNQVCCCPCNMLNFRANWSIKYLRWCVTIQMGYVTDMKGKEKNFKFSIVYVCWKTQKQYFSRIFLFFLENRFIRVTSHCNCFEIRHYFKCIGHL